MPELPFLSSLPTRLARRALAVAAAVVGVTGLAVAPAQGAVAVPQPVSTALVTRLTVDAGQAWVTVQVRIEGPSVVGFEVHVPADQDSWGGVADVAVRELGIHCRSVGGPGLHYLCGDTSTTPGAAPYLPRGSYQITLPASHTGALSVPGPLGHTWVDAVDGAGQSHHEGFDSFPVVDGSHFLSTAELRTAPLVADPGTLLGGLATLPVSMTVVPGEQVASLDVRLPSSAAWSMVGTNGPSQGIDCGVGTDPSGLPVLHCAGPSGDPLPAGRYQLVSTLRFAGPNVDGRTTRVALTMVGGTAEQVDTCHFRFPVTV